jgi:hypothetical protein
MTNPVDIPVTSDRVLGILEKQLERMRGMHYGYYQQFFHAAHLFTAIILIGIALSLWPAFAAVDFLIPFFVVYAGFFCAYLLCYNLFARIYANALEKKINEMVGQDVLVAHRMEDVYFYKTPGAKYVGLDLSNASSFIGAITISYQAAGALIYIITAYRAYQLLPTYTEPTAVSYFAPLTWYWGLLAIWTLGHLAYLLWFYIGGKPEREIAAIVNDAYGTKI